MSTIKPLLAIPLAQDAPREISQGWYYSDDEWRIHPKISCHHAVDFKAPWGTPVYAPADGVALASYHAADITAADGRTIGYGLGLFIQIWHEGLQLYSMYAHLSGLNNQLIPYIEATLENGNWQPKRHLYFVPVEEFKRNARPVHRGDLIGAIGYTGLRSDYEEVPANPPTVNPNTHQTWDPHGAHLHWEVYTRTPDGSKKDRRYDPFGIYGLREMYSEVFSKARGMIRNNPDGSPQFAK